MTTSAAPFVTELRARPETIQLGTAAANGLTIRVEMPEVWDTIRIGTSPNESVAAVKERALEALYPDAVYPDEFVLKLNGYEVRDENASLATAGVLNGSTLLLTYRRRRPVRN